MIGTLNMRWPIQSFTLRIKVVYTNTTLKCFVLKLAININNSIRQVTTVMSFGGIYNVLHELKLIRKTKQVICFSKITLGTIMR